MKAYKISIIYVTLCILLLMGFMSAFTTEIIDIPMRDSILLKTTVYKPDTILFPPPWSCIILRSPYGRTFDQAYLWTDVYGYCVIGQDMRGWGESQGIKTLFRTDGWGDYHFGDLRDGYDAIEWIAAQPWSNGKVGMYGFSGPGVVQYYAAGAQTPHLVCCIPEAAYASAYLHAAWTGGEFRKALTEGWCEMQGTPYMIDTVCGHPNYDSFYIYLDLATRWDSAHYPMFHMAGWYDFDLEGGLDVFCELQMRFHNQKLLVGPWGHWTWGSRNQGDLAYPANAIMSTTTFRNLKRQWYDYWMFDSTNGITDPKVTFYLMGECDTQDTTLCNFWVEADTWPLPEVQYKNYYIREGGVLDTMPPSITAIDTFQYDPGDPCESYGGKESWYLSHGYGPIDNQPIEGRPDVLLFSTPVLTEPLCVIGKIWFTLYGTSDCYDTDWTIRVTDVYPDGRSILITDGALMARHRHGFDIEDSLDPWVPDTFNIDVGSTANVFAPGHRLRVIISSSNYPRFEKNPNTGAPFMRNDPNYVTATNSVYRSAAMPSHLLLPVYPGIPGVTEHTTEHQSATMLQVSPNPFTNETKIQYALSSKHYAEGSIGQSAKSIELKIFDAAGRLVRDLSNSLPHAPCTVQVSWSGRDDQDRVLPSGVYFVQLSAGEYCETKKVLLIR